MAHKQKIFNKRILFVGMPDTAFVTLHALLGAGVNVVAVIPPPKSHPASLTFCEFVKKYNLNIILPNKNINEIEVVKKVKKLKIDLAVVTSYSQKISKELLDMTKDGFVNVHPSLLPEYRGANPYSYIIMNGEKQTGVTIHKMDESFDTGEILLQTVMPVMDNETMGTLFNKLNRVSAELLLNFIGVYETKGLPVGISQKQLPVPKNYAKKILPESSQVVLQWNKPASYLEQFIRALNPFLPAITYYKGYTIKVFSANIDKTYGKTTDKEKLGVVVDIGKTIDVVTGDGLLKIKTLQIGSFFVGDVEDFVSHVKIKVGDKFE